MDPREVRGKFGDDFLATERTFRMGIDRRLGSRIAERFPASRVLETCTGGGFCTIALARVAQHVVSVEIDPAHQEQARENVARAGLAHKVSFVLGDALNHQLLTSHLPVDAAFLDPDWAVTGPEHVFRFRESNTRPPADLLLQETFKLTRNVALVLPPFIDPVEYQGLPPHERQEMYLEGSHELTCLFFGELAKVEEFTECRVG
ncbi:MAG: methyltransferase domain-containing protein [Gemmatimonadota bacterium]|jgi:SAM-dependent methyltransferase